MRQREGWVEAGGRSRRIRGIRSSLPGLTRQSIIFGKTSGEERWIRESIPRALFGDYEAERLVAGPYHDMFATDSGIAAEALRHSAYQITKSLND
jgi:hypothetical protein